MLAIWLFLKSKFSFISFFKINSECSILPNVLWNLGFSVHWHSQSHTHNYYFLFLWKDFHYWFNFSSGYKSVHIVQSSSSLGNSHLSMYLSISPLSSHQVSGHRLFKYNFFFIILLLTIGLVVMTPLFLMLVVCLSLSFSWLVFMELYWSFLRSRTWVCKFFCFSHSVLFILEAFEKENFVLYLCLDSNVPFSLIFKV